MKLRLPNPLKSVADALTEHVSNAHGEARKQVTRHNEHLLPGPLGKVRGQQGRRHVLANTTRAVVREDALKLRSKFSQLKKGLAKDVSNGLQVADAQIDATVKHVATSVLQAVNGLSHKVAQSTDGLLEHLGQPASPVEDSASGHGAQTPPSATPHALPPLSPAAPLTGLDDLTLPVPPSPVAFSHGTPSGYRRTDSPEPTRQASVETVYSRSPSPEAVPSRPLSSASTFAATPETLRPDSRAGMGTVHTLPATPRPSSPEPTPPLPSRPGRAASAPPSAVLVAPVPVRPHSLANLGLLQARAELPRPISPGTATLPSPFVRAFAPASSAAQPPRLTSPIDESPLDFRGTLLSAAPELAKPEPLAPMDFSGSILDAERARSARPARLDTQAPAAKSPDSPHDSGYGSGNVSPAA